MTDEAVKLIGTAVGAISALIASSMALVSWSYETFETKEIGRERLANVERRLERIEAKIDTLRTRN
jgi:hypothetical protein